jgi:hypothetical protein
VAEMDPGLKQLAHGNVRHDQNSECLG